MRRVQILDGDTGTYGGFVRATNPAAPAIRGADGVLRRKASLRDLYDCPIHGPVPITSGSAFISAGNQALACHGDTTACGATLIAQAWAPIEEDGATEKSPVGRTPGDDILDRIILRQAEPNHCPTFSRLIQKWRDGPAFMALTRDDHIYVDNSTITVDWILQFERERKFIYNDLAPSFVSPAPVQAAIPWLDKPNSNGRTPRDELARLITRFMPNLNICETVPLFPTATTSETIRQQLRALLWVSRKTEFNQRYNTFKGRPDCLTMALANFNYRVSLDGIVTRLIDRGGNRFYKLHPTHILIFAEDSFDFSGEQGLWYWSPKTGSLLSFDEVRTFQLVERFDEFTWLDNRWFQNYRNRTNRGSEFLILLDIKKSRLASMKTEITSLARAHITLVELKIYQFLLKSKVQAKIACGQPIRSTLFYIS